MEEINTPVAPNPNRTQGAISGRPLDLAGEYINACILLIEYLRIESLGTPSNNAVRELAQQFLSNKIHGRKI